jgi:hypothetical protein
MRRVWVTFALLAAVAVLVAISMRTGGVSVTVQRATDLDNQQISWGPTAGLLVVLVGIVAFAIMLIVRMAWRLLRWLTRGSKRQAKIWD